jgi:seryl-tRNA synthetase
MDVKLQNAYVEVLLGNFMEVVKQNIMFQAQLELSKSTHKEIDELKRKIDDLTRANSVIQSGSSEKDRLQAAVNDLMRQLKHAKEDLLVAKSESQDVLITNNNRIEDLTKYISRLEEAVPASKLKKLKLSDGNQSTSSDIGDDVKDGGSF